MLQTPIVLDSSFEIPSAADESVLVVEFAGPVALPDSESEPLRGPWFPMFGDTPHYEPAI